MLAEHYWLVTNNILGLIADNKIYNTQHARRNTLAASVLILSMNSRWNVMEALSLSALARIFSPMRSSWGRVKYHLVVMSF